MSTKNTHVNKIHLDVRRSIDSSNSMIRFKSLGFKVIGKYNLISDVVPMVVTLPIVGTNEGQATLYHALYPEHVRHLIATHKTFQDWVAQSEAATKITETISGLDFSDGFEAVLPQLIPFVTSKGTFSVRVELYADPMSIEDTNENGAPNSKGKSNKDGQTLTIVDSDLAGAINVEASALGKNLLSNPKIMGLMGKLFTSGKNAGAQNDVNDRNKFL